VRVDVEGGGSVEADRILVAVGRRAETEGLVPGAAGVLVDDDGFLQTDDYCATSSPRVWAVGDVAGKRQLTHAADEMGRIAVGNAFGAFRQRRFHADRTPSAAFTRPEVGRVGMTEAEAAGAVPGSVVAFLPLSEVDRAIVEDETDGFLKVIAGPRWWAGRLAGGRILGATVMAPRGGDLVHEFALAMSTGMFPARLALATHAYPSWSVAVRQVVAQLFVEVEGRRAEPARAGGGLRT
jgi:pyruvate/2-oxoglutarate dehydrogenase complex dihydrolipoamide dehydrogenase (E3) component